MKELAADGIPVTVTCRVLKLARQPYYRWLSAPIPEREVVAAHRDDPDFGTGSWLMKPPVRSWNA